MGAAKQREEEELRRQIAEEAERKAELERQEAEEAKRRADEEARRNQEAAEAAERELKEAAQKVQDWLKSNKFAGPNDKKSGNCACATTYPIHEAAVHGQVDIVRGLLEAKADATQTNNKKLSALQLAELKKHAEVVALLQALG